LVHLYVVEKCMRRLYQWQTTHHMQIQLLLLLCYGTNRLFTIIMTARMLDSSFLYAEWSTPFPDAIMCPTIWPVEFYPSSTHAAVPYASLKEPSLTAMAGQFLMASATVLPSSSKSMFAAHHCLLGKVI
jgi:hypothetical protein